MKKSNFVNEQYYHIYNRGVEKRDIFLDSSDHVRFIHYLFALNDQKPLTNTYRFLQNHNPDVRGEASHIVEKRKRTLLVKIHCFCRIPNHYHLILEQLIDNGITKFMQKLGTAHAMYFNARYQRSGVLFQGKFKSTLIENDAYLLQLIRYIHLNPVEMKKPNWKTDGIKNWKDVNKFLKNYRWSSHPDYLGIKNFPSVTYRDFIQSLFPNKEKYQEFINQYLIEDFDNIKNFVLE